MVLQANKFQEFSSWLDNLPYSDLTEFHGAVVAEHALVLDNSLNEVQAQRKEFENLASNKRATAKLIAQTIDNKRTSADDLDTNSHPINLLSHKGETLFKRPRDKAFEGFLNFFQDLVRLGYKNKDDDLAAELNAFIKSVYGFVDLIFQEAKSLASIQPIRAAFYFLNPFAEEGSDAEIQSFQDYIEGLAIDDTEIYEPKSDPDKVKLAKYANSLHSKSNAELLDPFGPVNYSSLHYLWDHCGDSGELIKKFLYEDLSKEDLNKEYLRIAKSIEDDLDSLNPRDEEFQRKILSFIGLREFISHDYNESHWTDFSYEMEQLYSDSDPEDF